MDYFDTIKADDQFIRNDEIHDLIPRVQIVVEKQGSMLNIHTIDQDGVIDYHLLTQPENKDKIQETMNRLLIQYPSAWISWADPGITGVCFQIRENSGRIARFFRSDTRGAFNRRKTYANQNPSSTVSFVLFD